jgi:hypothetical protein
VAVKEQYMKRYLAISLAVGALIFAIAPSQAQFLKDLQQNFLGGGQQQGQMPGQFGGGVQQQNAFIGNVNLPPGQYMMSNVQTGQAFYVLVDNGQMYLSGQPGGQQPLAPGQGGLFQQPQQQQGGVGGMLKEGLGNFLKNQIAPQQQVPNQ